MIKLANEDKNNGTVHSDATSDSESDNNDVQNRAFLCVGQSDETSDPDTNSDLDSDTTSDSDSDSNCSSMTSKEQAQVNTTQGPTTRSKTVRVQEQQLNE